MDSTPETLTIKCHCGLELWLYGFTNECSCGNLYNQSGQELRPSDEWEESWDEE